MAWAGKCAHGPFAPGTRPPSGQAPSRYDAGCRTVGKPAKDGYGAFVRSRAADGSSDAPARDGWS